MKTSTRYLIPTTPAEDLRTSLQIQTQTLGRISRFLDESLNPRTRVSDMRPDIRNSDIRKDLAIRHGKMILSYMDYDVLALRLKAEEIDDFTLRLGSFSFFSTTF